MLKRFRPLLCRLSLLLIPSLTLLTPIYTPLSPVQAAVTDLRHQTFGAKKSKDSLQVTLKPGDQSLLVYAQAASMQETITLLELTGPQGQSLYSYDPDEETYQSSVFFDAMLSQGELSLYLPAAPSVVLKPGIYTFRFATASKKPLTQTGAFIRSGSAQGPQVIDLNFWIVSKKSQWHQAATYNAWFKKVQVQIEAMVKKHNLRLGKIKFQSAPKELIAKYAEIQPTEDGDIESDICRSLTAYTANFRQVNVALIDKIKLTPSEIENEEGETTGYSPGTPGLLPIKNALWSCVLINLTEANEVEQGTNLFHEISHMLGIYHTTESDGTEFDALKDTPECPAKSFDKNKDGYLEADECRTRDGQNYMFWEGDGLEVSADQAWVLRRHPLFYPAK